MNKTYHQRPYYLDKITPYIGEGIIKVLTGQRRVGKSYVLLQVIDVIKAKDAKANIIYINKEENEYEKIANYRDLITYVNLHFLPEKNNYLFIDEIQEIENFEKA